ncbi:MAG: iron-containing alcohol dehydrogenase [Oligoflexia bacterium]|nr:iron-containing alcohol dehydrogenase [Oligoflexia bacterium]
MGHVRTRISHYSFPTAISFGAGARHAVGPHLKAHGYRRPLVVTDRTIAGLELCRDFELALRKEELRPFVFSGVSGNPRRRQVRAGVEAFHAHEADSIIGLGGGAALDVAKAVGLWATHPGELFDYEDGSATARPIRAPIPYWVAVPTTAGTGSEVGRSAVISDEESGRKRILFSPKLLARAVFADPELTLGLPAAMTAATGMDALVHCVEAYLAREPHPLCEGIALQGVRLAGANLERCILEPADLSARAAMLQASILGGVAFQKGLGLVHSCAHALGAAYDLHHGLANGVMVDHALAFNIPAARERFEELAWAMGHPGAAEEFLDALTALKRACGVPARLSEAVPGLRPADVVALAGLAHADSCHASNPRSCAPEDFVRIFTEAL